MKTFKIKPQYIDLWGSDVDFDTVLTKDEIKTIAKYREIPVNELMKQVFTNTPSEISWYLAIAEKENKYHY